MQAYTDVVLSRNKGAVQGAVVTVRDETGNLATIYSDDGVTQQVNPITTDLNGTFTFYAEDGEYQLTVSGNGISTQTRFVLLQDFQNPAGSTVTLTDGPTVNWDMKFGQIAFLTLGTTQATRTLANPTNIRQGAKGYLVVTQGSAGGENITAYGSAFVPVGDLTINPDANSVTALWFVSDGVKLIMGKMSPSAAPAPAPSPAPAPAPGVPTITVADEPTDVLEVGNHIVHANVWNAVGLTRGTYTGLGGSTFEQQIGVQYPPGGAGDPIGFRAKWKFPTGTTEVKSYPSIITGNFPGWLQTGTAKIAGTWDLRKQDGTISTAIPSGKTPNTIFPIALPIAGNLKSNYTWTHNEAPTGRGHLAWDIWVQSSAAQTTGFNAPPIHTEIMIPLTYWGGYGAYAAMGGGRNPGWYYGDATIDGHLWHVFETATNTNALGAPKSNFFNGAWHFIVFEPDSPTSIPATKQLNLAAFLNYCKTQGWIDVPNPLSGLPGTHVVSAELGVECVDGTGDITVYDFDVTNT